MPETGKRKHRYDYINIRSLAWKLCQKCKETDDRLEKIFMAHDINQRADFLDKEEHLETNRKNINNPKEVWTKN